MKEQEKDILRGFSAGAAPTRREMNLAAPERRDARVGELRWPYRLAKDGGAEILGLPSPEPAGALTVPRQLDGHPVTAIADEAFSGCAGLVSVVLPDGVTVVDDEVFYGCENLTEIVLPASVMRLGRHVFGRCPKLNSIVVAEDSPYFVSKDGFLLSRDGKMLVRALETKGDVTIPAGVECIGVGAFSHCEEMTSVIVPEGVRTLWDDAFEFCTGLTTMTLPRSLGYIAFDVTFGCPKLKKIRVAHGDARRIYELFERETSADVNIDFDYEERC